MATAFEKLPKEEQGRLIRLKKYLKLLRQSHAITLKDFKRVTFVDIRNAENDNGAFTPKSKYFIETHLPVYEKYFTDKKSAYNTSFEIPMYVVQVLIMNPDKYTEEQVKACEYWARMLVPAIYESAAPMSDILDVWHDRFVNRYNCFL